MSWLGNLLERSAQSQPPIVEERLGGSYFFTGARTKAGRSVSVETSQSVATAYRAANIISDDIGKMPLQMFARVEKVIERDGVSKRVATIERVASDAIRRNTSYLLEISPNSFGWTPFIFKKSLAKWLLFYGNAYVWSPPVLPAQKFVMPSDQVTPVLDKSGDLWYEVRSMARKTRYLPDVEMLHVMINPDRTGFSGRGIVQYGRETLSLQLAAHDVESGMMARGLNPSMVLRMAGGLDKKGRQKIRESYEEVLGGSDNAGGAAVFDNKVLEFKQIDMKLVDMQFLESIKATDQDIANFFGMPLHMLNMGKEAYSSNEQKYLEYLSGTLDAYLVQIEQAARIRWLPTEQQDDYYFKFNRNALLRMDSKARALTNEIRIRSATMTPNEARSLDEWSAYEGGDQFYITKNYGTIGDGENAEETDAE